MPDNTLDHYFMNSIRSKNTAFQAFLQGYQHRMNNPKSKQEFSGVDEFHEEIETAFEEWYQDEVMDR
jgi:hypothetical protein